MMIIIIIVKLQQRQSRLYSVASFQ